MNIKEQTGWLSPYGDFTKCHYTDHLETAKDILKLLNIFTLDVDPEIALEVKGYIKISLSFDEKSINILCFKPVTNMQKNKLKMMFDYNTKVQLCFCLDITTIEDL